MKTSRLGLLAFTSSLVGLPSCFAQFRTPDLALRLLLDLPPSVPRSPSPHLHSGLYPARPSPRNLHRRHPAPNARYPHDPPDRRKRIYPGGKALHKLLERARPAGSAKKAKDRGGEELERWRWGDGRIGRVWRIWRKSATVAAVTSQWGCAYRWRGCGRERGWTSAGRTTATTETGGLGERPEWEIVPAERDSDLLYCHVESFSLRR